VGKSSLENPDRFCLLRIAFISAQWARATSLIDHPVVQTKLTELRHHRHRKFRTLPRSPRSWSKVTRDLADAAPADPDADGKTVGKSWRG
jgi:hypothetical protein